MKLTIPTPPSFSFWRTVYSHGWCSLPPFYVNREKNLVERVLETSEGKTFLLLMSESPKGIELEIASSPQLAEKQKIVAVVRSMFRLDEDFEPFYAEARKLPEFKWVAKTGSGRMLRAPTAFEDVIKMICTTNCSWALTDVMVRNLCKKLGTTLDSKAWSFPSAQVLANASEKFLRKEIRAGYRSPYLRELGKRVAIGEIELETWRCSTLPTGELFEEVRSIKGIGPYVAGNILKLLGRYDYLGIDSWCRKKFAGIHHNGRRVSDKTIERFYQQFGEWRGLFFWMDVTKDWYKEKFPF